MSPAILAAASVAAIIGLCACGSHADEATRTSSTKLATNQGNVRPASELDAARLDSDMPIYPPTPGSLLDAYAKHDPAGRKHVDRLELTRDAKRVVEAALTYAAHNDVDAMLHLATDDASFGLPDRAKRGARPLDSIWVKEFMADLRRSADRFHQRSRYRCAVLSPAASTFVATGAEPMWCYYSLQDKNEHLVFELTMRDGRARVSYVGFFAEPPSGPIIVSESDVPPDHPPLKRRNLDMTRRNIPAADPRLQQMRRLSKLAGENEEDGDAALSPTLPTQSPGDTSPIALEPRGTLSAD